MDQIIRHGAYGVVLRDSKILFTQKKSGPYKGLWGLPGGKIEFGETPEETLKRELLEESSMEAGKLEFVNIATTTCEYVDMGSTYAFHQVGIIYKVLNPTFRADLISEEENRWVSLEEIILDTLTPFAKHALVDLPKDKTWRPKKNIRGKVIA